MIALDSGQKQLSTRSSVGIVVLVTLDTFTDYVAQTIDETFYWASLPVEYKWDGSNVSRFRGFLKGVSPVARGFAHIPDANELSTRDGVTVTLDATQWGDEFPWSRLTSKNLIGAKLTVASLLVDLASPRPDDWQDLSALGAVHTVRFRGEVTDVPQYDDEDNEFTLVCDSIEAPLPLASALDVLETSEKDLGKTYPIPVGAAKRVPLVQRTVGWVTTLVSNLTETTLGNIIVTSTAGLPAGPFGIWIGTERLVATTIDSITINVSLRGSLIGLNQTTAQNHQAGAVMIEEIENANFVFSGISSLGVDALYARSPQSGELVLIPNGWYGSVQADVEIDAGEALGVVSFTQELWANLIRHLNNEASVTIQPAVATNGVETIQVPFGSYGAATGITNAINCTISGNVLGVTDSNVVMDYQSGGSNKEAGVFWCNSASVPQQSRSVARFRVVWNFRIESNASITTRLEHEYTFFGVIQGTTLLSTLAAGPTVSYRTAAGAWHTPSGKTLADMVNGSTSVPTSGHRAIIYLDQTAGGSAAATAVAVRSTSYVEVELNPLPIAVTTNTETTGAQEIGFNLDLFADVRGAVTLGAEAQHPTMDDKTGWLVVNVTLFDVGGGGFQAVGDGTNIFRQVAKTGFAAIDFSSHRLRFDYNMDFTAWNDLSLSVGAVTILLLSTAGNFVTYQFPRSCFHATGWREFTFDPNGSPTQIFAIGGTVDLTSITQININWNTQLSTATSSISFRDMRSEVRTYHTHPIDIAEWLIEENAGITNGADSGTFATAKANLPSVQFAGDLRQAGANLGEMLARIGFESRTNFVAREIPTLTFYRAFNALATYAFAASSRTLTEFNSLRTRVKQLDEQTNEFIGLYDFRNQFDQSDVQGYAALLQANALTNDIVADVPTADITDSQARVGVRPAAPLAFFLVADLASMLEVFAYYVQESLRGDAKRYSMRVPLSSGYELEPGDIVDFTPRWSATTRKSRVVQTTFTFDAPSVEISMEEVL